MRNSSPHPSKFPSLPPFFPYDAHVSEMTGLARLPCMQTDSGWPMTSGLMMTLFVFNNLCHHHFRRRRGGGKKGRRVFTPSIDRSAFSVRRFDFHQGLATCNLQAKGKSIVTTTTRQQLLLKNSCNQSPIIASDPEIPPPSCQYYQQYLKCE